VANCQLRKSVSLRSLVAVADSSSPLAAAGDNQGPTPLAPPTLAPLPIADVSDSLLWQMYGPILNDLLVSALAQVNHIVNSHQVSYVRWLRTAPNSIVYGPTASGCGAAMDTPQLLQARRTTATEVAELLRDLESMSSRLSGAYRSLQNVARLVFAVCLIAQLAHSLQADERVGRAFTHAGSSNGPSSFRCPGTASMRAPTVLPWKTPSRCRPGPAKPRCRRR